MGNILRRRLTMFNENPIIVVLGCTGTGKSKLAIELAKQFNGEIISADSMQVYEGLDIITNKVTSEEQMNVPHHFISCIDPLSRYTVVDFQIQALQIIDKIVREKKLPIIVGGTNYYIESLLWDILIPTKNVPGKLLYELDDDDGISVPDHTTVHSASDLLKCRITQHSCDSIPSPVLHDFLKEVDPAMANELHPENRRKVIRSLQVYQQHGIQHSKLLTQQKSQSKSQMGGPLKFKNAIMLWLMCDKDVLEKRLDERVDEMIDKGLLSELLNFHKMYNEKRATEDKGKPSYTEGIFQSIGFKEFHEYLILNDEERSSESGKKILENGIEAMKLVTRQYSKKQVKWIVNRFLRTSIRELPPVYGLDATHLDKWHQTALQPAIETVDSLLKNQVPSHQPLALLNKPRDVAETHYCDVCERTFVGKLLYENHLKSRKHSKRQASLKKQALAKQRSKDSEVSTKQ